jgi:flavin-dependent dehydrogenase
MTHNATGEGIYHAMQSGVFAADAVADILQGVAVEEKAFRDYTWRCRRRFTFGFVMGHVLRGAMKTPLFDWIAMAYNNPSVRKAATWAVGSALAGSSVADAKIPIVEARVPVRDLVEAAPRGTPSPSAQGRSRRASAN